MGRSLQTNPLPHIEVIAAGQSSLTPTEKMAALAVPVPSEIARFEGQQVVFIEDLLAGVAQPFEQVCCRSPGGESYVFKAADVAGFSLLSTNAPSWKLVPAGRQQLHEITTPRFVLREVASVELGAQFETPDAAAEEDASDQVFTNLSDALRRPQTVRYLNLTTAHLESFPTGVLELPRLESLNLGNNRIESLPDELGDLTRLKVLKLSRNRIRCLPDAIGRLKQLVELHASHNELNNLPEKLWNLQRLEVLSLGSNRLEAISDDIVNLGQLRELILDNNLIPPAARQQLEQRIPNAKITW